MEVLAEYNVLSDLVSAILCTAFFFMWSVRGWGACLSYPSIFCWIKFSLQCVVNLFVISSLMICKPVYSILQINLFCHSLQDIDSW